MPSSRVLNHQKRVVDRKFSKFPVKKGDVVSVITGSDKGKKGEVIRVFKKKMRVIVKGVSLKKKVVLAEDRSKRFASVELPIHVSNVKVLKSDKV